MNLRHFRLLLVGLIAIGTCNASAGVINKELEQLVDESNAQLHSDPNRSTLRCWQHGKLLFEEADWRSFNIKDQKNVLNFTHKTLRNQSLSLVNFGETVCLYRKVD